MSKAQASMEYILLFSFSLLIVGVLWYVSNNNIEEVQWELQLANAKNSLEKIVHNADVVYLQGPPSRVYIEIYLPENVKNVYIAGNSVTMEMYWREYLRNVSDTSIANLTGSIPTAYGKQRILISAGPVVSIAGA
jgi:uncharacterized protein (UPF0333 family)